MSKAALKATSAYLLLLFLVGSASCVQQGESPQRGEAKFGMSVEDGIADTISFVKYEFISGSDTVTLSEVVSGNNAAIKNNVFLDKTWDVAILTITNKTCSSKTKLYRYKGQVAFNTRVVVLPERDSLWHPLFYSVHSSGGKAVASIYSSIGVEGI